MPRRRRHPQKALTAVEVRQLTKSGRHADGGGLYLVIDPSGARRWVLRTIVRGRRRDIGLGSASLVSLAEARETAALYRKTARAGGDPIVEHRRPKVDLPTFAEAARTVHQHQLPSWRNEKHAAQWLATLEAYALPYFGDRRVDEVEPADVLRALSPIWLSRPETARRVRQRIRAVLDWAKGAGYRRGDNPVEGVARALPRHSRHPKHHTALPYADVPAFMNSLATTSGSELVKLALELLVLTAARTNEVIGAKWDEIDFETAVWTVPAERMKAKREHRVPLTARAIEVLRRAKELSAGSEFVFPGRGGKKPLSNMAMAKLMQRKAIEATPHGFRSSFRDWASETTTFPREVAEMALAHTIRNKAEAAYRRGDLLEKRRTMMTAWADFVANLTRP